VGDVDDLDRWIAMDQEQLNVANELFVTMLDAGSGSADADGDDDVDAGNYGTMVECCFHCQLLSVQQWRWA